MAPMSLAWRTCSISTPRRPIPRGRWCVSTKARRSSSAKHANPSRPRQDGPDATTTNIAAMARSTCSSSLTRTRPWRTVKVTDQRTARDFAECMRDLVDIHYPQADLIRVVMDNLSTHCPGALYEAFPAPEAHRVLRRLQFHYTPKHASWLNMVEIEIGVLRGQCLNQRIGERKKLVSQIAAWQRQRNSARARIKW